MHIPQSTAAVPSCLMACFACLFVAFEVRADVEPITSIADITSGTTVDFEQPGGTANDILPAFDMTAAPDVLITSLTSPVIGNSSAPMSHRALFPEGVDCGCGLPEFRIETTGLPWAQIGLSAIGNVLGESRTLTLNAFDANGVELGSVTRIFAPTDGSFSAYNDAAVFVGLGSTTPIFAIDLISANPNVAWDDLRFNPVNPAPEPSTLFLLGCAIVGMIAVRFHSFRDLWTKLYNSSLR